MAQITIVDTGYVKTDNSGSQLSSGEMANAGVAINLKTVDIDFVASANLDPDPSIGTYDNPDINMGGHNATSFTLKCKLDMADATEKTYVGDLLKLRKTVGYKALFYDGTGSEAPTNQMLYQACLEEGAVFTAGEKTKFSVTNTGVYHLAVYIKTVHLKQKCNQGFGIVTITGFVAKKHASVI